MPWRGRAFLKSHLFLTQNMLVTSRRGWQQPITRFFQLRSDSRPNTIFIWRHKLHLQFQMKIIAWSSIVLFRLQNLHTLSLPNALGFLQTTFVSLQEGLVEALAERQYELCLLQLLVH
uniref:Uncharacterized protein n=1 Tax=Opuntia streptacantha TaxID=393608 RepID=A0A7C9EP09_OPUST